jgi:hypothetical protein
MSQFTVLSSQAALGFLSAAQAAHDLRNLLATLGLHVETLQRLVGPGGAKAGAAAHALLERSADLCNSAIDRGTTGDGRPRRRGVDLLQAARQCADLLASNAPKGSHSRSSQADRPPFSPTQMRCFGLPSVSV